MTDSDLKQIFASVWKQLSLDSLCREPIRSLRKRGINPKSLVEPMCWFLFLDGQLNWGLDRLASQGLTGQDRRSLKRLPEQLAKHLKESRRLESEAGRPLKSFRGQREKLDKETKGIHPSAVLSPDLLIDPFPGTLEDRSRLLKRAVPNAPEYLRQSRKAQVTQARDALGKLVQTGLSFQEISHMLDVTAETLGLKKYYSGAALKMRFRRMKRSV